MIHYRRWYKTMVYQRVAKFGDAPVSYIKEVICDGWYLFGKFALVTRENFHG